MRASKIVRSGIIGVMLCVVLCWSTSITNAQDKPMILKFAFGYSKPNPAVYVYESFADAVNKRAKGRLAIEVYQGGALGGEGAALKAVLAGNAEIFAISNDNFAAFDTAFLFSSLPYMFESQEHAMKVLRSPIGQAAKQRVEEKLNVKVLFVPIVSFFRTISNTKREIRMPDDCKGLKLRVTDSMIELAFLESLGILPTPISWGELYSALKQGVVDGTHNQYLWTYFGKFHESIKYITEVKAMGVHQVIGMRKDMFDKLGPDLKEILMQ
ncbi:MAG: TRAP transporter substrate-binding protein, partial [Pseudomonadota bacterium]